MPRISFIETSVSKQFARRLLLAIDAECLSVSDLVRWADVMIERTEHPPVWLCELSTSATQADAAGAIADFAFSDPCEQFPDGRDEFIGYLWVRYEKREFSWARFLDLAGRRSDGVGGLWDCEKFYAQLNEIEVSGFSPEVEARQAPIVLAAFEEAITNAKELIGIIRNPA